MMQVSVQLREDVALDLQNDFSHPGSDAKKRPETEKILAKVAELGVKLTPVNPGQTHPLLAPFFMISVKDRKTAEQIISHLQNLPGVEGAYFRPADELPAS